MARERREGAQKEKDSAERQKAEAADCSSETLSQATGTVTGTLHREDPPSPGYGGQVATAGQAGVGGSELVAVGQSESNQKARLDAGKDAPKTSGEAINSLTPALKFGTSIPNQPPEP